MSKGHAPRPYDPLVFGQNYDHVFRRSDPMHAITPGMIREYRSDCCGAEVFRRDGAEACSQCLLFCVQVLTKVS